MSEYTLPCGEILRAEQLQDRTRRYTLNDFVIWKPSEVHRVALLQAILIEDGFKYKSMTAECPTIEVVEAQNVQDEFDDFCIKNFGSGMSIRDKFILEKFFKQNGYEIIKETK